LGEQHEGVLIGVMKSYLIVALLLGTLVMIAGKKFEPLEADRRPPRRHSRIGRRQDLRPLQHFRVTPPSIQMVLTLERAGLIRRQPGVGRSIEVLVPPQDLPVLDWLNSNPS
jgi:hypothetical protein